MLELFTGYWKNKSLAMLNNSSRRQRENSEVLVRKSLLQDPFTNPEAEVSVCILALGQKVRVAHL